MVIRSQGYCLYYEPVFDTTVGAVGIFTICHSPAVRISRPICLAFLPRGLFPANRTCVGGSSCSESMVSTPRWNGTRAKEACQKNYILGQGFRFRKTSGMG